MKTKPKTTTPPPGTINAIAFSDIFTLHEIQHLQDLFANATGVASIITHPDGTPITKPSNFCRLCNDIIRKTEKGRRFCFLSDSVLGQVNHSGPVVQPCLSGELWDAGASIVVGGKHLANWLIGQVRNEFSDELRMMAYADEIGANREDFLEALKEVPVMSLEQFQKVSKMLFAFAKELSEKAYNNLQLKMRIADREQAEKTISMLAHAIRSISECVSITDMDDQIIFVNSAFLKTYQYEEHELLGKSISMVRSPNNPPAVVMEILPATMNGGWHGELMNQRKDGSEFPVFVSSTVIQNENNEPLALIGVTTDISERRKAEREILELNEALDHRVKLRTEELEAANKELETFSYSISHDLKTPLRHINGFINLMVENKDTNLTEKDHLYLNSISGSATEMTQLIDAILSFSKLNLAELRKTRIRSARMVQQVIKFFEPDIQYRKIIFKVESLPDVYGDERLIRQVWTNIISNAIKYSSKKAEAIITIGSSSTDDAITFFIRDNGAGFNMKYADKLFGVFHRLHKSKDFEGVGIGLANVNRIVSRHGGHCRAEGEPGVGATIFFTLPHPPPSSAEVED